MLSVYDIVHTGCQTISVRQELSAENELISRLAHAAPTRSVQRWARSGLHDAARSTARRPSARFMELSKKFAGSRCVLVKQHARRTILKFEWKSGRGGSPYPGTMQRRAMALPCHFDLL